VFQASKQMFDFASQTLDKCGTVASCYLGLLDQPIPTSPTTANWRAIKASWMTVIYGQGSPDTVRSELLKRVDKIQEPSARLAVAEAIDELAPRGDIPAADALDAIVKADKKSGEPGVLMADDSVVKIALRLRARAAP
jgi:hypothetical protein